MSLYLILAIISIFPCIIYTFFIINGVLDLKNAQKFDGVSSKQDELIIRGLNSIRHNLPNFILSLVITILLFSL